MFSVVQQARVGSCRDITGVKKLYTEYNMPVVCLFAIQQRSKAWLRSARLPVHFTNQAKSYFLL